MNLISNDRVSTSMLYSDSVMAHGFKWGQHRYVRREGSPGNYRYVYPEDLTRGNNNYNATLFGDRQARRTLRLTQKNLKRMEKNKKRLERKIERDANKAFKYAAKSQDFTKDERYRAKYEAKAKQMQIAMQQSVEAMSAANRNIAIAEAYVRDAKEAYNQTRLTDDIAKPFVDLGRRIYTSIKYPISSGYLHEIRGSTSTSHLQTHQKRVGQGSVTAFKR